MTVLFLKLFFAYFDYIIEEVTIIDPKRRISITMLLKKYRNKSLYIFNKIPFNNKISLQFY